MIKMVSLVHVPSGITLFSEIFDNFCAQFDENFSSDLIGSFLSAIKSFSKSFGQNEIKQIEMSTLKFLIYEKKKVLIYFLLENSDQNEIYEKSLIMCLNAFMETYNEELSQNYNQISNFKKFNSILREILKIPPDKIELSCLTCPMAQKKNCLFWQVHEEIVKIKK